jgi:hypothetical protein
MNNNAQMLNLQQLRNDPNVYLSYYAYSFNIASLAAGASDTDIINIENDSQFIWTKTSYFAELAGAAQTDSSRVIPLITCMFTDSGSARQFFDQPQPINSIAGQGSIPFILPSPFVFKNNANVNASFTNFSAAQTYLNFTISLHGYRVYTYGNSRT